MEENFNIVDLFFSSAKKYPDKLAIIDKDKKITFSKFEDEILKTAHYFTRKGIKKGDRVMLFVPMSIDLYRIVLALFHIGATAVFLDEWVNRKRMEECCKVADCKAFIGIFKARILALFLSELRKIPIKLGKSYSSKSLSENKVIDSGVCISDTALITFTTGSTGTPKAAKRTHGFLREQFNALIDKMEPTPNDVDMPVLPIVLLINLGVGCTSIITEFNAKKPEATNVKKIIKQINHYKVSRITSSPFFMKKLSKYCIEKNISTASVKKIFTGGAPVFPNEATLHTKAFPYSNIEIVYGSTEAEPISFIDANELINNTENSLKTGLNVGKPYRKTKVKIIEITTSALSFNNEQELDEITLPSHKIGEIIVSGSHVLREYFNNESALKQNKIFIGENCWHRTGDSGYLDEKGCLFLTGRCNTLIRVNNKIIAPFMYENFFQSIYEIEIGTVMQFNNKLTAIIELKDEIYKNVVIEKIKSSAVQVDEIKFVSKIPRDPRHYSKIDYERILFKQIE
jgi:olefin beta-lactone synthetase